MSDIGRSSPNTPSGVRIRIPRVLVVEDSDESRGPWVHAFTAAGFTVDEAANGLDALSKLRGGRPEIIVLDLILPGLSGFAIAREARSHEKARTTVIVAVTGVKALSLRAEAISAGCDLVLDKPVDPAELVERARRIFVSRHAATGS